MRLITVGLGIAVVLATSVAAAAPAGGAAGEKGNTGGKGGLGPENSTQSGAQGASEQSAPIDQSQVQFGKTQVNADKGVTKEEKEKPWEIGGAFETHRLLEQNYLTTSKELQTFNIYSLYGRYSITENDIVSISGGASQYLQADPGEPGWRLFDISLAYTHRFQLPAKFNLSTTGGFTLPVSYYSQLASNITSPFITVGLSRKFGDLYVAATVRGGYSWDRWTSQDALGAGQNGAAAGSGAGAPNIEWSAGGALTAEYSMPFHRALSVGAAVSDSYAKPYDVGQCPLNSTCMGATTYPNQDNQPWQQSYSDEIFVRYILPDLQGFKSDILLALANGDPGLGNVPVLHDGVVHPYLMYYNTAEVYVAISGRY
ncbi:MAG TPA: hypothetical protein VF765_31905 [Polyangiaceae bacterium]